MGTRLFVIYYFLYITFKQKTTTTIQRYLALSWAMQERWAQMLHGITWPKGWEVEACTYTPSELPENKNVCFSSLSFRTGKGSITFDIFTVDMVSYDLFALWYVDFSIHPSITHFPFTYSIQVCVELYQWGTKFQVYSDKILQNKPDAIEIYLSTRSVGKIKLCMVQKKNTKKRWEKLSGNRFFSCLQPFICFQLLFFFPHCVCKQELVKPMAYTKKKSRCENENKLWTRHGCWHNKFCVGKVPF